MSQKAVTSVEALKEGMPWYAKIAIKLVMARLPVPYGVWARLRLIRHGDMDKPEIAIANFESALKAAGRGPRVDGLSVLEIGPGDALSTAVVARALGAREVTLVDAGRFARQDLAPYNALIAALCARGHDVTALEGVASPDDLLARCNARYLTDGVKSFASVPTGSVDFICSNAVLEHVRIAEFPAMLRELRRVTAPTGNAFHIIDLQDHLAHGLNNLRFPTWLWEASFMARSGFYTNRIRYTDMLGRLRAAGYTVEVTRVRRFTGTPKPLRAKLAPPFRTLSDEELGVSDFDVVLTPKPL